MLHTVLFSTVHSTTSRDANGQEMAPVGVPK